jgi:serine/threonine-protein kinase HipA
MRISEKQIQGVFYRMIKNKPIAGEWINNSFLSKEMKEAYVKIIEARYNQIKLTDG